MTNPLIVQLASADELRQHMDLLNESGHHSEIAGVDCNGHAFLACLRGPYAEWTEVFFGSPWDGELDYGTGTYCDECNAANTHTVEDIKYPVTVFQTREITAVREDVDD